MGGDAIATPRIPSTSTPLSFQPRHGVAFAGELIGALVLIMAGLALDPVPAHLMRL
jgi:hypothetical protein